ncbi:carbohydrate ABC transporter permease [Vallitalea guaymasensis]|uniref:Carbohydrate ABC transporter permease n=1 Tax=Vallitalea guaymasensis TaxID=1185412 RepID=A0A8J8MF31_9FIRM|nr:carbohydrate ABC transporter permease [Vallitalea guaymasensis]QUH31633.1 carbohydrate ABC transporter permease [Vallitalea guaymasensis]
MEHIKISRLYKVILAIILIGFAVIQIYPFFWLILFSLKDNSEIFGGNVLGLPQRFLWQNYQSALVNGSVGLYFSNSVIVTSATILISGLLSSMVSYVIGRMNWKYGNVTLLYFTLGLMMPIHAALLPLFLMLKYAGILNSYWALIIPYVGFAMPLSINIMVNFFATIPKELEEAASIDGANIYQTFGLIMLPLLKPVLAAASIFTYIASWNELMFAVTFVSKKEFRTLTVGIMSMVGQYSTNWGPIGAGLVVATVPTVIAYILMSKDIQKSLTAGAVKG